MRHLYFAGANSRRGSVIMLDGIWGWANSIEEAEGLALSALRDMRPQAEGWHGHMVKVGLIPWEAIKGEMGPPAPAAEKGREP